MSLTVTWSQTGETDEVWNVSNEALASLDAYRLTLTKIVVVNDVVQQVPRYATVKEMIVGTFLEVLVNPALAQFPPPSIAAARTAAEEAKAAYEAAKAAAAQSVLQGTA